MVSFEWTQVLDYIRNRAGSHEQRDSQGRIMASTLGGALEEHLGGYSDIGLKIVLISLGLLLIAVAILPVNRWVKLAVAAWVILP